MQLHCFVNHSGTGPFVFEALHQFTLGDSIKRPFPKKYKGKPFSCFNQIELLLLLVAIRSYVIDVCQWIFLPLVCQSRDQFHDIIQRKLLSCFNELNLLLCWFWFDHMLQLFLWFKSRKIFTRVNISTVSLFVLLKKLQWMDYEKAFLWNFKYYTGDAFTLWSHSRRRQLY